MIFSVLIASASAPGTRPASCMLPSTTVCDAPELNADAVHCRFTFDCYCTRPATTLNVDCARMWSAPLHSLEDDDRDGVCGWGLPLAP